MFNVELCQKYVESLIRHDELERALLVLNNVPAEFRMNPPKELLQLKGEILAASVTPFHYAHSEGDDIEKLEREHEITDENVANYLTSGPLRAKLLADFMKHANAAGGVPHIIDYGPGHFLLPRALMKAGYRFTYWDVGLNVKARQQTRELLSPVLNEKAGRTNPTIFLGLEVIEHLHNVEDLAVEAVKQCGRWPETVMLSTPYCTYRVMPDTEEWRTQPLEHLRAYTPKEFQAAALKIFPHYAFGFFTADPPNSQPMSLVGTRVDLVKN